MDERTIPFRAVEVQIGSTTYSVAPGTSLAVPFALVNHTGHEDYFDIQVQGIPVEWILLDMPVIHLGVDERREASITIQAPGISPLSQGVYPVTLRAVSQSNKEGWGEAGFNLTVRGMDEATRPAPVGSTIPFSAAPYAAQPLEQGSQIGVTMDRAQYNIVPGQSLSIPISIANRGLLEDTFFLAVEGLSQNWVSFTTPSLHLFPGEQRPVTLVITPPHSPASRAGRYPFRLLVSSQTDASQAVGVDVVLTVTAVSRFEADLNPRFMNTGRTARLRIHNLSNIQDTYQVNFQSQDDRLEFITNLTGPVNIMPDETVAVDFNVSRRGLNWFGGESVIPYSLIVQSAEGETQSFPAEVSSRPVFPLWVLPVLLVFLLTAICGLGFLWNWNQNRLAGATQTAAAALALMNDQTATALVVQQTPSIPPAVTFTPVTPAPSATVAPTLTFTAVVPTFTPVTPTITSTLAPTNTQLPTIAPFTLTPLPSLTATSAPVQAATATTVIFPVAGQQLFIFAAIQGDQPQLFFMNTVDHSVKALTQGPAANTQPAWSPDGSKVVFTSNRDGNNEIYIMAADGSNPVNLTRNPGDDHYPAWSPDGTKIMFTSNRDGNNEIYVMNADGSNPVNLTKSPANDFKPVWYTQSGLLTSTSRILFTSDRDGHNQIYAMNTDGSNPVNLSKNTFNDSLPDVSFKGGKVAFVSDRDGNQEIYSMALDGSGQVNLTQNPAADTQPAWSPDEKWIAFTSNRSGVNQAYIMAADGKQVTILSQTGVDTEYPAWH